MGSLLRLPAMDFVDRFSKINLIRAPGDTTQAFTAAAATKLPIGNSREAPTRFRIQCPYNCGYSHGRLELVRLHARDCRQRPAAGEPRHFPCRKGCDKVSGTEGSRDKHEQDHTWVPKSCRKGCQNGRIFETKDLFRKHLESQEHQGWPSTQCNLCLENPGSNRVTVFRTRQGFMQHLREIHYLDKAARKKM